MRLLTNIAAGLWLAAVGWQGLVHMTRYGLLPLPPVVAAFDLTPAFPALAGLLALAAVAARRMPGDGQREHTT